MNEEAETSAEPEGAEAEFDATMDAVADRIVLAALSHVPFDGWSWAALRAAAQDCGFDPTMAERALPRGPLAAIERFGLIADKKLEEEAARADLASMKTGERIAWLVRRRLDPWFEQREAVRRAVSYLALPFHQAAAARAAWHTADSVWHCAGDPATDISWYSRRAILMGVYAATLLVWLEDKSEGCAESWAFLGRRLADVGRLTRTRQEAEKRLRTLPEKLRRNPLKRPRRRRAAI